MKECRALQSEMLATLQSFRSIVGKQQVEAPSCRENSPSQEGTSASNTGGSQGPAPCYLDEEEAEASEQSSLEDEEDLDQDNQFEASPGGHLFSAEDMEGLLKAIYASEDIQMPSTQVSAQDKVYRGLGRPQTKSFQVH